MTHVFYTYIDWTLEDVPRRFYIGKGCYNRLHNKKARNPYWAAIANKYGWRREIVLASLDESYVFLMEKAWIAEYGTFENGSIGRWGANLTEGGEGPAGRKHTNAAKEKNRLAHLGRRTSPEVARKISQLMKGRPAHNKGTTTAHSTRVKMSQAHANCQKRGPSVQTCEKIGIANQGKIPWNKGMTGKSKLTWDDVNLMRNLAGQSWLVSELAVRFNVTSVNVRNILTFKTWKLPS